MGLGCSHERINPGHGMERPSISSLEKALEPDDTNLNKTRRIKPLASWSANPDGIYKLSCLGQVLPFEPQFTHL